MHACVLTTRRTTTQVDWNWWVVFVPMWLLHVGQLVSWIANKALAMSLARGLEDNEGATEVNISAQLRHICFHPDVVRGHQPADIQLQPALRCTQQFQVLVCT